MNIVITSGGTSEKIDDVREITNFSTGRLGMEIARAFLDSNNSNLEKIYYLCDKRTVAPEDSKIEVVRVSGVQGLLDGLKNLLTTKKIDAVIHAMAVSDYAVGSVTTLTAIKNPGCMVDDVNRCDGKISSEIDDLVILLKRTPKVIGEIKKLSKDTILVGFKLLTNVDKDVLIDTAGKLLQKNGCDMVLANDLTEIYGDKHGGYLLFPNGQYIRLETKKEIAQAIADQIEQRVRKGE